MLLLLWMSWKMISPGEFRNFCFNGYPKKIDKMRNEQSEEEGKKAANHKREEEESNGTEFKTIHVYHVGNFVLLANIYCYANSLQLFPTPITISAISCPFSMRVEKKQPLFLHAYKHTKQSQFVSIPIYYRAFSSTTVVFFHHVSRGETKSYIRLFITSWHGISSLSPLPYSAKLYKEIYVNVWLSQNVSKICT